jgi:hypothetical protein
MKSMSPDLALQIKVSRMLGLGFVCSLLGTGGITSLVAFVLGLRARGIIIQSGGAIVGIRMAWWCIIVGGVGGIILPVFLISAVVKGLK